MIDNEVIYNKEYLIILPISCLNLKEQFVYSFENVFVFNDSKNINKQINIIKKSHFNQIIFVDYCVQYKEIISSLEESQIYKIIFTKSLGSLSNNSNYEMFSGVLDLIDNYNVKNVGFLDYNMYFTFKTKINCSHISLDIEQKKNNTKIDDHSIGVLNDENNPMHSFYNELSAIKLANYKAVLKNCNKTTKDFLKLFKIKYRKKKDNISGNILNLYINFTDNNNLIFIESMDQNVPCILGNNELLKGSALEGYLSVDSDDSIDEIKEKIEIVKNNKDIILKEYTSFRKEYSKKCKKEISDFLNYSPLETKEKTYEKLLTIVVPVYNVEAYLDNCLKSILKALPNKIKKETEILIINDGSTDNSELIIKNYLEKYKDLFIYINQKNGGLGHVRNVALEHAKGKYIASIDSDDTIDKNFFKKCLKDLENDIDIIIYDWLVKTDKMTYPLPAIEKKIFDNKSKYEGLLLSSIMPSTCNKIMKKSLFEELDIKYVEDKYEDFSTNPFILLKANTIKYYNKPYYKYYIRNNSIMRSSAGISMINILKEFNNRLEKYKEYCNIEYDLFKYYAMTWRMEEHIFNQIFSLSNKEKDNYIKVIYNDFYDNALNIINNKYYEEMVNKLSDDKKDYIVKRNKALKEKKLIEFYKNNKNEVKLDAMTIYYGDKKVD
jgi:glycosyltransferase involved in cell wall biosynthesis